MLGFADDYDTVHAVIVMIQIYTIYLIGKDKD